MNAYEARLESGGGDRRTMLKRVLKDALDGNGSRSGLKRLVHDVL
jgi:hypothetical protein